MIKRAIPMKNELNFSDRETSASACGNCINNPHSGKPTSNLRFIVRVAQRLLGGGRYHLRRTGHFPRLIPARF
jgi:hypothetical protein